MGNFIYSVLSGILSLLVLALILNAVLSWLVAFGVINLRNSFVAGLARFLDAVTNPILRPFRRFIPPLGGVDITPIIAILVIQAVSRYLLPWLFAPIINTLGG